MKRLLSRFSKWEYKWLCLLVVVVLVLHFAIIKIPDKPVFDEAHYVTDARGIIAGQETVRGEHPSLGKLFVIAGMLIFGDNALGWRFFSVILSAISLVLFYLICRNLSMSRRTSFLATFLLAFENLTFLYSGMAMLDVSSLTFTLGGFLVIFKGKLSGIRHNGGTQRLGQAQRGAGNYCYLVTLAYCQKRPDLGICRTDGFCAGIFCRIDAVNRFIYFPPVGQSPGTNNNNVERQCQSHFCQCYWYLSGKTDRVDFPVGPDPVLFPSQLSGSSQLYGRVFNYSRLDLYAHKRIGARLNSG